MPLSVVESSSFRTFVQNLDPRYHVPSIKLLSQKILPEKYKAIETKILATLGDASNVSITLNIWSNRQMKAYIGILAHFINNWKLYSLMLTCKRMTGRHTAENILAEYENVLGKFKIEDKIAHIVTDNASNMVKAF